MTEEQKEDLIECVHEIARMQYVSSLLERYKLSGYVRKKTDSDKKLVLEHPEKAGWYVTVSNDGCVVNVFEEGLKVSSVIDETVLNMTYWDNGKLKNREFRDVIGNVLRSEKYSEEGGRAESVSVFKEDGKKKVYLEHSLDDIDLLNDYEKIVELVNKNKFWKVAVKRHLCDFGDKKYMKKVSEIENELVELEKIDYNKFEFVEGTIV